MGPDEFAVVEDGDLGPGDVIFGEGATGNLFGLAGGDAGAVE